MSDGAHLGVSAKRALDTVLGNAGQPDESERRTPDEMRVWLLAALPGPWDYDGDGYEQCARWVARVVLENYLADPRLAALPMDSKHEWERDRNGNAIGYKHDNEGRPVVLEKGLYDTLKERGVDFAPLGISGFQWGWAVNAARYCVEVEPQPNPAIMTIGSES